MSDVYMNPQEDCNHKISANFYRDEGNTEMCFDTVNKLFLS